MDHQEISDRLEITDLLSRYTYAVDHRAWHELRKSVFVEESVLDYSSVGGPVGPPSEVVPWIERGMAGFARYQHVLGQVLITFDGADAADVLAWFTNPMVIVGADGGEQLWEVGGFYRHRVERRDVGWRSLHLVDDVIWRRGF